MDADKKMMMIREIEHWRRSKILPEHYCDFLLNLYAMDEKQKGGALLGISSSTIRNSSWKGWLAGGGIACLALLAGLNFTSFDISLQIAISLLGLLVFYTLAYRLRSRHPLLPNAMVGLGSLFLLVIGIYLMKLNGVEATPAYAGYIAAVSLIWLLTGMVGRMPVFHFSGWMGLVGVYAWMLNHQLGSMSWLPLELSWLPLCVLFLWCGWLFQQRSKRIGGVLFLVGCIVWIVPELFGFAVPTAVDSGVLQISLILKVAIGGVLLFSLRKKWIEWVA